MKLSIGIVGLPNVGKSTLFNALLKKQVADVANYPFCTIEPNVGVIEVPDERLAKIAKVVNTQKIVPAIVEFYDIAGLVKGASKGEGLGNKFLSHIREVAAIVHVLRLFDDSNVIHVSNKVDPKEDLAIIEAELMLADLETLGKQHEPKQNGDKEDFARWETIKYVRSEMDKGIAARAQKLNDEQREHIRDLNLLTMKPVIYVFNVSEKQLENKEETESSIKSVISGQLKSVTIGTDSNRQLIPTDFNYLYLNAKLEAEIVAFPPEEQKEYLKQYGLMETGLNRLIQTAYSALGLISFLTGGELEARAWTIEKGTLAPQAAGTIHTDFEKKFIKADVIPYQEFIGAGGWTKAREQGKVTSAGKDYEMKDGDVVEFKIGQ